MERVALRKTVVLIAVGVLVREKKVFHSQAWTSKGAFIAGVPIVTLQQNFSWLTPWALTWYMTINTSNSSFREILSQLAHASNHWAPRAILQPWCTQVCIPSLWTEHWSECPPWWGVFEVYRWEFVVGRISLEIQKSEIEQNARAYIWNSSMSSWSVGGMAVGWNGSVLDSVSCFSQHLSD